MIHFGSIKEILVTAIFISTISCSVVNSQENVELSQEFKDYWYQGKAELTRYKLEQARYGEIHEGDAVLIFVTEDFLTDKQVKYESGDKKNTASVLKLNFTREFLTGIYPYSMISSVFTPVDHNKPTLKVATSTQEWCGHTFSQLNHRKNKYEGHLFSYFQKEGDQTFSVDEVMLEDEIWTKVRLNPSVLPTGDIRLIPGTQFLRLKHRDFDAEPAVASLETFNDSTLSSKPLIKYRIDYKDFQRVLQLTYESEFPYAIVAWEEQSSDGKGQKLTTRAIRTHAIKNPYWSQHSVADTVLRKELGLKVR